MTKKKIAAPGTGAATTSVDTPNTMITVPDTQAENMSVYTTVKTTKPIENISRAELFRRIREGVARQQCETIWNTEDKDQRATLKEQLPCVTVSGLFDGGHSIKNLIQHSGEIALDFDGKDNPALDMKADQIRDQLAKDPYVAGCSVSAGGSGLFANVVIDPSKHKKSFRALASYFKETYGLIVDESAKDVSRVRYIPYDPNAYLAAPGEFKVFEIDDAPSPPIEKAIVSSSESVPAYVDSEEVIEVARRMLINLRPFDTGNRNNGLMQLVRDLHDLGLTPDCMLKELSSELLEVCGGLGWGEIEQTVRSAVKGAENPVGCKPPASVAFDRVEPVIYFDDRRGKYMIEGEYRWRAESSADLKRSLHRLLRKRIPDKDARKAFIAELLDETREKNTIDAVMDVGGRIRGLLPDGPNKILVPKGITLPTLREGKCDVTLKFIKELLGEGTAYFHGWMRRSLQMILSQEFSQAQVLAFIGEPGCGKSTVQRFITAVLGGGEANATEWMLEQSGFNGNLGSVVHLACEDARVGKGSRTKLAERIKMVAVEAN